MPNYLLIVNPTSGRGFAGRSLSVIEQEMQKYDLDYKLVLTERPWHVATADLTLTVLEYLKTQGVDPNRIYLIQNRAVGLEGLTKAELEKKLGLSIGVTMPYMGDNFTVANNRHEPLASRFREDSAALLLKQAGIQMLEMDKSRKRR
jgi:hypothetical protein